MGFSWPFRSLSFHWLQKTNPLTGPLASLGWWRLSPAWCPRETCNYAWGKSSNQQLPSWFSLFQTIPLAAFFDNAGELAHEHVGLQGQTRVWGFGCLGSRNTVIFGCPFLSQILSCRSKTQTHSSLLWSSSDASKAFFSLPSPPQTTAQNQILKFSSPPLC